MGRGGLLYVRATQEEVRPFAEQRLFFAAVIECVALLRRDDVACLLAFHPAELLQ